MEDPHTRYPDERAAQGFVGEPLWQLAGRKPVDHIMLEGEKVSKGIAFDEYQPWEAQIVVERQDDSEEEDTSQVSAGPSNEQRSLIGERRHVSAGWQGHRSD